MGLSPRIFRKLLIVALMLLVMAAYSVVSVSAETTFGFSAGSYADDCVIPESGPWPPCATGGTSSGDSTTSGNACPASGKWPPGCVPGGSDGGTAPAPGQPCPASGAWPAGCVPGGSGDSGGGTTPAPGQPCPASGAWPAGCVPNGGGGGSSPAPAPTPAPEPTQSVSIAQIERRIIVARQQLEDYWLGQFQQWGISYQPPALVQLYVGGEGDPPNAFFVPASNAIFIDLRLLTEIAEEYGEYGAVAVLAHEWAHFIQDELDLLSGGRSLRQIELQADCFSGSFTTYLSNNGLLGGGEYEAARGLFFSIGDDQINPGAPYNQPGAHGTGVERQTAFESGWLGDANSCRNSYNQ